MSFNDEYLTAHFKRGEFTFSEMATRGEIDNSPSLDEWENLRALSEACLEPARAALGPIRITSGYRCPALNTAIGGAENSQHIRGQAADIIPVTVKLSDLFVWLYGNVAFDQIIWEFGQWIHVSHVYAGTQRKSALLAYKKNGKTVYAPITQDQVDSL